MLLNWESQSKLRKDKAKVLLRMLFLSECVCVGAVMISVFNESFSWGFSVMLLFSFPLPSGFVFSN